MSSEPNHSENFLDMVSIDEVENRKRQLRKPHLRKYFNIILWKSTI